MVYLYKLIQYAGSSLGLKSSRFLFIGEFRAYSEFARLHSTPNFIVAWLGLGDFSSWPDFLWPDSDLYSGIGVLRYPCYLAWTKGYFVHAK